MCTKVQVDIFKIDRGITYDMSKTGNYFLISDLNTISSTFFLSDVHVSKSDNKASFRVLYENLTLNKYCSTKISKFSTLTFFTS